MITSKKKGGPARLPYGPQNAERVNQSITKKKSFSTNSLVKRLNGGLAEFSDSELLLELQTRQFLYLEILKTGGA